LHKNRRKKHHPTKSNQKENNNGWYGKVPHKEAPKIINGAKLTYLYKYRNDLYQLIPS